MLTTPICFISNPSGAKTVMIRDGNERRARHIVAVGFVSLLFEYQNTGSRMDGSVRAECVGLALRRPRHPGPLAGGPGPRCARPSEQCSLSRTRGASHPRRPYQIKTAPHGVPFLFGGGGGNRTPVRKPSTVSSTYLAVSFDLTRNTPTGRLVASDPLGFRPGPRGGGQAYFLLFMTLLLVLPSPARRPTGAASGLKRPERKIRRWRLSF